MLDTFTTYRLIARDVPKAINRVEAQPMVTRETEYYLANIGKVKSIDEFVKNDRLFKYAMKAFGLKDMDYAKAFMVKALKEGVADPDSFANKLTDKRYAQFVSAFNFEALGSVATVHNPAQHDVTANYALQAEMAGIDPTGQFVTTETSYYLANIVNVKSVDDLMANERLYSYALAAYGLDIENEDKDLIREVLMGGAKDPNSAANKQENKAYAGLAAAFDFKGLGQAATTHSPARDLAIEKFMRQTLEEDAGRTNEGVRLALYFERKASTITNWYDVLADKALASVVRTALGLPDSFASADIDKQAALFEKRLNIADFTDPQKLGKFMTRFTSLYEISHPTSTASTSVSVLFAQPTAIGISTDLLFAMQRLKV
jgi:hypothetical protein